MKIALLVAVVALASGGWARGAERWSYVCPHPQLVKPVEGQPGRVRVKGFSPYEFAVAMQQFLLRHGWVVASCFFFSPELGRGEVEVEDSLEGAREVVRRAGGELIAVGERVVLMTDLRNEACQPLGVFFTAKRVAEMGGAMAAELSEEELAWLLMATALGRSCPDVNIYYWPTHEGQGRQYYVYEVSMDPGFRDPLQASLRKVSVERRDGVVELTEMWVWGEGSGLARSVPVAGPVTTLELDFDDDGVIDIVAVSEDDMDVDTIQPVFDVISGRTGEKLGKIKGEELVITRSPSGVVVRTLGRPSKGKSKKNVDGTWVITQAHRRYVVEEGKLVLAAEQREDRISDMDRPLLRPERKWEDLASLAPGEQLLAHFAGKKACTSKRSWHGMPVLDCMTKRGEDSELDILTPRNKKALEEANVRVLVDYRPPKREEPPQL